MTTTEYLNQLIKAYTAGKHKPPENLVLYVSFDVFQSYADELLQLSLFSTSTTARTTNALYHRMVKVKTDYDLQGPNVRWLESEYAYNRR